MDPVLEEIVDRFEETYGATEYADQPDHWRHHPPADCGRQRVWICQGTAMTPPD